MENNHYKPVNVPDSSPQKRRPTIGMISNQIWAVSTGAQVLSAAAATAQENGYNLIIYQGQFVNSPSQTAPENIVYEMIDKTQLDGLVIWASTLTRNMSVAEIIAFCDSLRPLPIVSIGMPLPGIPALLISSYEASCQIITHLITVHHCGKIAFIRGPQGHHDSEERYRAYLDMLSRYQLPLNPNLISDYGAWTEERIRRDLSSLIDERNESFDALVAPSDELAIKCIRELKRRGIRVPEDVAVVGVNNIKSGTLIDPPLTTTTTMLAERAALAVKTLIEVLAGKNVPPEIYIPFELVVRRSCGCPSPVVSNPSVTPSDAADRSPFALETAMAAQQGEILAQLQKSISDPDGAKTAQLNKLLDCLIKELQTPALPLFIPQLEQIINQVDGTEKDFQDWTQVITTLRNLTTPLLTKSEYFKAENLWYQSKVLLGDVEARLLTNQESLLTQKNWDIHLYTQQLNATFELPQLLEQIDTCLINLGFGEFYLSLFDNLSTNVKQARLILARKPDGRIDLANREVVFNLPRFLPDGLFEEAVSNAFFVIPLFFETNLLGFILLEQIPIFMEGITYTSLQIKISSALWGTLLLIKQKQTETALVNQTQRLTRSNNELQQFAYVASHDLQEPLRKITVFCGRLQESTHQFSEQQLDYLERMQKASQRMQNLINDLLTYSRLTSKPQTFTPVALSQIAEEVIGDLEVKISLSGARVEVQPLPVFNADPMQMRQLFQNLISNGLKFHRENCPPVIMIWAEPNPDGYTICFKDNGIGIEREYYERIFVLFERLHGRSEYEGSGIGLAICKKIVERHGGSITIESTPGSGTQFNVYLPAPQQ